jgi:hypothetical protein
MDIKIHNQRASNPVDRLRVTHGNRDVVDQTEPANAIALRVMPRRANNGQPVARRTATNGVSRHATSSGCQSRQFIALARKICIGIEARCPLKACLSDFFQEPTRVHARQRACVGRYGIQLAQVLQDAVVLEESEQALNPTTIFRVSFLCVRQRRHKR